MIVETVARNLKKQNFISVANIQYSVKANYTVCGGNSHVYIITIKITYGEGSPMAPFWNLQEVAIQLLILEVLWPQ